jgi:hypothetical protein
MLTRVASLIVLALTSFARPVGVAAATDPSDLTVHEWGTFTTVAGDDGRAIAWLPLGGPTDLPCFVEHFQNRTDVKIAPNQLPLVDYETARSSLWGKVRMETLVLYFYTPKPMAVGVRVRFPHGLMTEWYPHASVTQPLVNRRSLRRIDQESIIAWPRVMVSPGNPPRFPEGLGESHYYAARNTDAAPLVVGGQRERFLFYRGVASFDVPLAVTAFGDTAVRVNNLGPDALRGVILFENHRGSIRYSFLDSLRTDVTLSASRSPGSVRTLRHELERLLVSAGLYPREATAMVDSWRDSWFEEGTRVFYIMPSRAVNAILPLTVTPAPDSVARVFVGRMEVITPAIERAVERAILTDDGAELERRGRFLGPITDAVLASTAEPARRQRIIATAGAAFTSFLKRASTCQ